MEDEPIVPQVQKYAEKNSLKLEPGWKVKIAMQAKTSLLKGEDPLKSNKDTEERWKALFSKIES